MPKGTPTNSAYAESPKKRKRQSPTAVCNIEVLHANSSDEEEIRLEEQRAKKAKKTKRQHTKTRKAIFNDHSNREAKHQRNQKNISRPKRLEAHNAHIQNCQIAVNESSRRARHDLKLLEQAKNQKELFIFSPPEPQFLKELGVRKIKVEGEQKPVYGCLFVDEIGDDLIDHIFSYLGYKEFASLRQVCKFYYRLVASYWKDPHKAFGSKEPRNHMLDGQPFYKINTDDARDPIMRQVLPIRTIFGTNSIFRKTFNDPLLVTQQLAAGISHNEIAETDSWSSPFATYTGFILKADGVFFIYRDEAPFTSTIYTEHSHFQLKESIMSSAYTQVFSAPSAKAPMIVTFENNRLFLYYFDGPIASETNIVKSSIAVLDIKSAIYNLLGITGVHTGYRFATATPIDKETILACFQSYEKGTQIFASLKVTPKNRPRGFAVSAVPAPWVPFAITTAGVAAIQTKNCKNQKISDYLSKITFGSAPFPTTVNGKVYFATGKMNARGPVLSGALAVSVSNEEDTPAITISAVGGKLPEKTPSGNKTTVIPFADNSGKSIEFAKNTPWCAVASHGALIDVDTKKKSVFSAAGKETSMVLLVKTKNRIAAASPGDMLMIYYVNKNSNSLFMGWHVLNDVQIHSIGYLGRQLAYLSTRYHGTEQRYTMSKISVGPIPCTGSEYRINIEAPLDTQVLTESVCPLCGQPACKQLNPPSVEA